MKSVDLIIALSSRYVRNNPGRRSTLPLLQVDGKLITMQIRCLMPGKTANYCTYLSYKAMLKLSQVSFEFDSKLASI